MNDITAKIVSDGTRAGTTVVNAETGENLGMNITALRWEVDHETGEAFAIIKTRCRLDVQAKAVAVEEAPHLAGLRRAQAQT
jgi:hypothetical protein